MILSVTSFIGRFHPALVHLPIGILLLACLFQLMTIRSRYTMLQPAIPVMLFWGMISAVLSCITGYILANSGDYEGATVNTHQWMGIITAIFSFILYILYKLPVGETLLRWLSFALIIVVGITGHLGGSLTHGADFLNFTVSDGDEMAKANKPIPNIQQAIAYNDLVQPILQAKCYGCHGPQKQKGKLRLDQPDMITKGGKSGEAIIPGKPDESELIERLLLPLENDDHMPPPEKPQLTRDEISILHWWVNTGADFQKKVANLPQTKEMQPLLLALQSGSSSTDIKTNDIPQEPVRPADVEDIKRLQQAGVMILPVAANSNYLSVNFVTATSSADSLVRLLEPLTKQIAWLKLDNARISDSTMPFIARLTALTRLHLSNTRITDKGLVSLESLQHLKYLNLVNVKVTAQALLHLNKTKKLEHLYIYQTGIGGADLPLLHKAFPLAKIDTGGYTVPALPTDTMKMKY
jgi:uncharacterized membrane protein/mono/diheme cytochrome c family protein